MNSKLAIALLAGTMSITYSTSRAAIVLPTTVAPQQPQSGTNMVNGTASGMMNAPVTGSTTQTINQPGVPYALPQNVSEQGTNAYDAAVTRQIRERITRSDLSINAHNVKIITRNGQVVLRGPVDSRTEQTTIQNIATDIVGPGRVRDETTVK